MKRTEAEILRRNFPAETLSFNEPASKHTSFKTGGNIAAVFLPRGAEDIKAAVDIAEDCGFPWYVSGYGSNLLISDAGFGGLLIKIAQNIGNMTVNENKGEIVTGAGQALPRLSRLARDNGLSGLEFACGIPGSVGGAVFMNAGACGGEIKDVVLEARVLQKDGKIEVLRTSALGFGYRRSILSESGGLVLAARFALKKADKDDISRRMEDFSKKREETQPMDKPSAGSAFKRAGDTPAAMLIDKAGLKGLRFGGAAVSEKHAGFIVNDSNASAADIYALMAEVKKRVADRFGVELEPEVRFLGKF
ncbi:MAG: UDP-N-acetylmuramate dehydrogenase [Clostridiales bacterium]|jgi:UDP-N-acetylmuramate dehydrogenase|nr:UDP-N-acetylmuramate dehydrogenase [Clostridiales bacterium]